MGILQLVFMLISVVHLMLSWYSWHRCRHCGDAFTLVPKWLVLSGAFVWGDVLVFSPFWFLIGLVSLTINDVLFFSVVVSLFWTVRSAGEVLYWFHQQFSPIERNKPKDLLGFKLVNNDAIWFVYQIFWQCVLVVALIASIVSIAAWLPSLR